MVPSELQSFLSSPYPVCDVHDRSFCDADSQKPQTLHWLCLRFTDRQGCVSLCFCWCWAALRFLSTTLQKYWFPHATNSQSCWWRWVSSSVWEEEVRPLIWTFRGLFMGRLKGLRNIWLKRNVQEVQGSTSHLSPLSALTYRFSTLWQSNG